MALALRNIIDVRILFLLVHDIRILDKLDQDIELIPKFERQCVSTAVTIDLDLAGDLEFQEHETVLLVQGQLYLGIAMPEILLLISLEEPIRDPVGELMDTGFQAHERYFKFPTAAHECYFQRVCKVTDKLL